MKSGILKAGQDIILALRLNYIIRPFAVLFRKLYYVSQFADWKREYDNASALKGFVNREDLYSEIIKKQELDKIWFLEFGVSKGVSMRWWLSQVKNQHSRFFGFDTFEGIPQDFGTMPKGSFTNEGNIPEVNDARCTFFQGLFQETLPGFLPQLKTNERLVIHLDADLYSSTLYCLLTLSPYLKSGDLLIFDQFNVTTHEFRALMDFQSVFDKKYSFVGEAKNYVKVVLKIG